MPRLRDAGRSTWVVVRSAIVVALATVFTLFALAEGLTRGADTAHTTATRILNTAAALTPIVGAFVTCRLRRGHGDSTPSSVTAAAWIALALANLALVTMLLTTGRTG